MDINRYIQWKSYRAVKWHWESKASAKRFSFTLLLTVRTFASHSSRPFPQLLQITPEGFNGFWFLTHYADPAARQKCAYLDVAMHFAHFKAFRKTQAAMPLRCCTSQ